MFEIKKHGGPWGTSAQNPNFKVCMFAKIVIWILRRCTLMPAFFLTPTNKGLSRSLFCANKNFCPDLE